MINSLLRKSSWIGAALVLILFSSQFAKAQRTYGGPYTPDTSTVLLMHFDGDLSNASDSSANGTGHGTLSYIDNSALGLGKALRIDNGSPQDSSFVTVPDTAALDLDASWTIEGWINIFTFGDNADSYRWVPRLLNKRGEQAFYTGNYYMEMWGNSRLFKAGYHTASNGGSWIEVNTPNNMMKVGEWYHWSYIRDDENHVLISVITDQDGNQLFFGVNPYDPINDSPPQINDMPLYIGFAGGGSDSFLDGFVDEIRISNTVRSFPIPPVFTAYDQLDNQTSGHADTLRASAYKLGTGKAVTSVKVHYKTSGSDQWNEVSMNSTGERSYEGLIPEQPVGSIVQYYYSATDGDGMTSTIPNTAVSDSNYFSFGVYQPETETLAMDFENGSGIPVDSSMYHQTAEVVGQPEYSSDAISGDFSLQLNDTSWVNIDSPFLNAEHMQVEAWFKADSLPSGDTRLIGKTGSGAWWQQNFEIKFLGAGGMAAGSYIPDRPDDPYLINSMALDSAIVPNKWYHAIYQLAQDTAYFELRDANDIVVDHVQQPVDNPVMFTNGPLQIGHAGPAGQSTFPGKIDNVQIYNYAKDDLTYATPIEKSMEIPNKVTLSQNYPNPFNPTTNIKYTLPSAEKVTLKVYDMLGREVYTLVNNSVQQAGAHTIKFDASHLSSGVYLYRLETKNTARVRKMLLIK